MNLLLLDNFDSFTYNLVDYLEQAGAHCRVLRNNVGLNEIRRFDYQGIVLSPGPGTPRQAGCMQEVIAYYYQKLPMLGICLGHQALGEFFGARLVKASFPMHGKLSGITHQADSSGSLFEQIPERIDVVRYHSLVLQSVEEPLVCLAKTDAQEIMAFRHKYLPIWGVQFHPEAVLTQYGHRLLKNWVSFN